MEPLVYEEANILPMAFVKDVGPDSIQLLSRRKVDLDDDDVNK